MRNVTVAKRYARALFELAVESKSLDDVLQGLNNIKWALDHTPDLPKVLKNPLITPDEKQILIKSVSSNKLILRFVRLLAKRKRMDLFSPIHDELVHLADQRKGIRRVLIRTAIGLTDSQKKSVEKDLAQSLGGTIIGKFEVAKELIGGVWLKLGDKVLDASLRGQIDDLRHTLVHSTN